MPEHQSIIDAKELHYRFPFEVNDFLNFARLYIRYEHFLMPAYSGPEQQSQELLYKIASRILDRLDCYQDILKENGSLFSYMLFQPSTSSFMENCLLQYTRQSDCNASFKNFITTLYS